MSKRISFDSNLGKSEMLALYLGALEKGYQISDVHDSNASTQRTAVCEHISPNRSINRLHLNVPFETERNSLKIKTIIHKPYHHKLHKDERDISVSVDTLAITTTPDDLNEYVENHVYFEPHQDTEYIVTMSATIYGKSDNNSNISFGPNKNDMINQFDFFIKNLDIIRTLSAIQWFNNDPASLPEPDMSKDVILCSLGLKNFSKLRKYSKSITKKLQPSQTSITRTIELLKDSLTILRNGDGVSSSAFNIRKAYDQLIVKIGGMDIIHEYSISKYKYLRHPGIEIMAAMLEYGKAFLNLENQFNKALLRRV